MQIHLKKKPLSVNEAWQGRRFKTDSYKNYEQELLYTLPICEVPKPPFSIKFVFGVSKLTDWDNPIKPLQDILQKRYGFNDRDIYEAIIRKVIVKKGQEFMDIEINTLHQS